MPLKIAVLAKQVLDPEMPMAAFRIDENAKRVVPPANIPPVVNGFDENAVEAALRIKDAQESNRHSYFDRLQFCAGRDEKAAVHGSR